MTFRESMDDYCKVIRMVEDLQIRNGQESNKEFILAMLRAVKIDLCVLHHYGETEE